MELERGRVVRSLAGRDKGRFLVCMDVQAGQVQVCDGKERPIERLKVKNAKHLSLTKTILPEESLQTNRKVKAGLHPFNYPAER